MAATLLCGALVCTEALTSLGVLRSDLGWWDTVVRLFGTPLGAAASRPYPALARWADTLTMLSIGLGLAAAVSSAVSGGTRGRRSAVGTAAALPALAVVVLAVDAVADPMAEVRAHLPDAGSQVSHYGTILLVASLVGAMLAWRARRAGGIARIFGALALMSPLALRLWELRPGWLLKEAGGAVGAQGYSVLRSMDVARELLQAGSGLLIQFAMVLAALVGVVWLCSPSKGDGEHVTRV